MYRNSINICVMNNSILTCYIYHTIIIIIIIVINTTTIISSSSSRSSISCNNQSAVTEIFQCTVF